MNIGSSAQQQVGRGLVLQSLRLEKKLQVMQIGLGISCFCIMSIRELLMLMMLVILPEFSAAVGISLTERTQLNNAGEREALGAA